MKRKTRVIFFNASVILAGLASPNGGSGKLLARCKKEKILGVISEIVFDEVIRNTGRIGYNQKRAETEMVQTFSKILKAPDKQLVENYKKIVIDHGDAHILASSSKIKADFLVTLDKKHLLILKNKIYQIKIVTPKELIEKFF